MALDQHDIRIATASEYDGDDALGVQCDPYGGDLAGCPMIEQHHPYGFKSRAMDPDADGTGCQLHTAYEGSRQHAWLSHDPRMVGKIPNIKPGESMQYGFAGNFVRCHADGSVSISTTDTGGDAAGQSVYYRVKKDGFLHFAPWGTQKFDASGFHILTNTGVRLDMGGIGGLPGPLGQVSSYFAVQAGIFTVNASAATFGVGAVPLVRSLELSELLTLMNAFCTTVGTVVAALVPASGASGPQQAAVATALTALEGPFAALLIKMQSIVSGA